MENIPPVSGIPVGAPSQDEKTWALLAWVLSLVGSFIVPLIFYVISNDKPFAKRHAAMCLGMQICLTLISVILLVTVVGALLLPVVGIAGLVFLVMGAMAANKGERYDVPVLGPFIAKTLNV